VKSEKMTATEPVQSKLIGNATDYTINYASSKYGELKLLYPNAFATVESGLDRFSWISAPLVQTVENAKPLIDRLDDQLSPLVIQLQQRAVLASQHSDALYQSLLSQKEAMLKSAQDCVDTNIAVASEKKNELVNTVRSYQGSAVEQVGQSLEHAQAFTSKKSKQWMHIDLIEYSKTVLDQGRPVVSSMYSMFEIPEQLEQPDIPIKQDAAIAKTTERRTYLRARLYDAIRRARAASSIARQVPGCMYQLLVASPEIATQTKHQLKTSDQSIYQGLGVLFAVVRNVVEQSLASDSPSELTSEESTTAASEENIAATECLEPCKEGHAATSVATLVASVEQPVQSVQLASQPTDAVLAQKKPKSQWFGKKKPAKQGGKQSP
jgi:hypothetical protein